MRKLAILSAALALVAVSLYGCDETTTEPDTVSPDLAATVVSSFGYEVLANGCEVTEGVVLRGKVVLGTNGPDLIWCRGATGPVHIVARGGNDVVSGGSYDDLLHGGDGCDYLSSHGGDDIVRGGRGNDDHSCSNGPYFNIYYLGGLCGGPGDDLLFGGPGTDRFNSPSSWCNYGFDSCSGGPGTDSVFYNCDECRDPDGDC